MTAYYTHARVLLDPEHAYRSPAGRLKQPVSLILTDNSQIPGLVQLWPSAVTLDPGEARQLASDLVALADEAQQAQGSS